MTRAPAEEPGAPVPRAPERVRFSPSPTGGLHLGGARTALFDWLVARRSGGSFIVRIEDTDTDRCDVECEAAIVEDLAWLGLDWDEGPEVGGAHAPYRQSERWAEGLYAAAVETLVAAGAVYPCFCTPGELDEARHDDERSGVAPRYRGPCCDLPADAARERLEAGETASWRFRIGTGPPVAFDDIVHGPMSFERSAIGDFVVTRSDGTPVYDLAAAVDDTAMGITLVLRGDDHLSNTPRQILLLEALGATPPRYAHVPLVHGSDGKPLSKSRGAASIGQLRRDGYLPEAVLNHIALLGWSDPQGRDVLAREELLAGFDLARVSRSPSASDPSRLDWLNERHIRALSPERLRREVAAVLSRPGEPDLPHWFDLAALAEGVRHELVRITDARVLAAPLLAAAEPDEETRAALDAPGGRVAVAVAAGALDSGLASGDEVLTAVKRDLADGGVAPKHGLPGLRAALTGRAHGLPLPLIIDVIGVPESRARLRAATM
jgi:nondiscriminating glutamyl-tRNA synthetase